MFPIRGKIPPVACGSGFGVERVGAYQANITEEMGAR